MYKSLEEIKLVAEKFEAGKIVPRRVLSIEGVGEKRARSDLNFTRNMYRVLGKNNIHVFLCDYDELGRDFEYCIQLRGNHKNLVIQGASHNKSGNHFIGNYDRDNTTCLDLFNRHVFGKIVGES